MNPCSRPSRVASISGNQGKALRIARMLPSVMKGMMCARAKNLGSKSSPATGREVEIKVLMALATSRSLEVMSVPEVS